LPNPVKSIHDLRMVLCRESAPPAIAVKFDNQHALGISRHLHGAIGAEVVSLMGLHSTLLGLLRFARNDIINRLGISTGSEFRSTAAIIQPVRKLGTAAVAWQTGSDRRREYRGGSTLSFCNAAIDGREVSLWVIRDRAISCQC
jgi:hypothetical protein